jgi:hypothetical protein
LEHDGELRFNGFLVDAEVTWITLGNLTSSPCTVPPGKALWLLFHTSNKLGSVAVDGLYFAEPLLAGEGQVISSPYDDQLFRGYLRDN